MFDIFYCYRESVKKKTDTNKEDAEREAETERAEMNANPAEFVRKHAGDRRLTSAKQV